MGKVDEVLTELRTERERLVLELARLDRVIDAMENAPELGERASASRAATAATTVAATAVTPPPPPPAFPPGMGPYTLMDIYEATWHYLSTVNEPKNSREIADALRAGGFKTRSANLVNTVRVMLRRKDGHSTGISTTKDGTRWFVNRKEA
jgi:hypothetical protein